ncbi:DNA ligase [Candidatus Woesearchaeota archaeon]|nr:MAG: DNA ligase [Candidatus Woesearchaeota archaeon]
MHKIAAASGIGSQEVKINILSELLKKATKLEARYIARIVSGRIRLGLGDKTILDSLSIAKTGSKEHRKELDEAYHVCPDVGNIAEVYLNRGLKGLEKIDVQLNRPVQMMLCQRVARISEAKEKLGLPVAVEFKYDGERIQAHKKGNDIKLYSRRLDDITGQFPDVVEQIKKNIKAKTVIIEGEAVAVGSKGNLLPFQKLMQRKRKHKIEEYVRKIPVCLFLFDLLYLNGKSFIHMPYFQRHNALKKIVKETNNIRIASRTICRTVDCIEQFFENIVKKGGEGVVIKSLSKDSFYEAGKRGWNWIKWKPEYAKGLRDTFDLVVVGAFFGRGRRAGTYGALLCAAYNKVKDRFETFCKLGSGFTDKQLKELPEKFKRFVVKTKPARVLIEKEMKPDVFFVPEIVVEVTGAEITKSPNHTCAKEKGQGLALRFPRFLRYRDKKPEDATCVKEILRMFKKK